MKELLSSLEKQGIATIPVGPRPEGIGFNADNGNMYVTSLNSNTVSVIDSTTNTVIATIPVGRQPWGVAFDPVNGNMYVTNMADNNVSVIAPLTTTFSSGCSGTIDAGQAATCDITNTIGR